MMKLRTDHSRGAYAVEVNCYVCGTRKQLASMAFDLNGPSYEAYYCQRCIPDSLKDTEKPCFESSCIRDHRDVTCGGAK